MSTLTDRARRAEYVDGQMNHGPESAWLGDQQTPKTGLLKMMVCCKGDQNLFALHEHETRTIDEAPTLVGHTLVQVQGLLEEPHIHAKQTAFGRGHKRVDRPAKTTTSRHPRQTISGLRQNPVRRHKGSAGPA